MRTTALALLLALASTAAAADVSAEVVQHRFNTKFRAFLSQDSQSPLPLPQIEQAEWRTLKQGRRLQKIYSEPNRFYNGKSYTFTMYRDDQTGVYYLDAKGGFWGMEELVFGPMNEDAWQ